MSSAKKSLDNSMLTLAMNNESNLFAYGLKFLDKWAALKVI